MVLHDFDKAGFSIVGTLQRDTRRYTFTNKVEIVDLGLRLGDVNAEKLPSERVSYGNQSVCSLRLNLRDNGATDDEIDALVEGCQRVELNTFPSDRFITWIEGKLRQHGVKKFIPEPTTLEAVYRRAVYIGAMNEAIEEANDDAKDAADDVRVPKRLAREVRAMLKREPALSWDAAVARIAERKATT